MDLKTKKDSEKSAQNTPFTCQSNTHLKHLLQPNKKTKQNKTKQNKKPNSFKYKNAADISLTNNIRTINIKLKHGVMRHERLTAVRSQFVIGCYF